MKLRGRETTLLLVPIAAICLLAAQGSWACPRLCACYVPVEVHCTFRYLTSIPDRIPPSVQRMNLGYNSLTRLTATDFRGLSKLELLMLHSNGIQIVPDKTFSDLQALQVLKMSYNKVRRIQKDTFSGLRSLTRLHMDHNSIEFINPQAFRGLSFLRLVHLEGNRLTKLHPDTFVSLHYLKIFKMSFIKFLYLSDNFLTSLPQEMFSSMPHLDSLYLHGNPWTCDCHLKWLSDWIQERPDVLKCKKDRSPSSPQQCPLCMNPRISKGKPFAMVPATAFLCTKPTIDSSLKSESLTVPEDSGTASISPQDFMAPFGSLTLNMTDLSGNEAQVVCSIQKPSRTLPVAFTEEKGYVMLNMSFSTFLVCNMDDSHIRPVWQVLALYSDSPLILERNHLLAETPQLSYKYQQVALKPEDVFTNIEANLWADPAWLMQDRISLQLNRTATTLSTLQMHFSSDAQVTLPRAEMTLETIKWTIILRSNNSKLEHTVVAGGTVALDCPGQGDPPPHLEWLLADGSKVRAPYVSEDGRIHIDKSGRLELQMADSFDTGIYHCVSTSYDDADILTYRITVVEPEVEATNANGVHQIAFTGETLDLPCLSTGIPDASISWVLPGNTVLSQSSGDKQVLHNGTLRILHVTPKDQGHYRCVAANPSGVEFLIFQVSVKLKDSRSVDIDGEPDGSGFDEPNSSIHSKQPPPPTLASMAAKAGTRVSSRSKNSYGKVMPWRRGDSTNRRRFREHRRQFPPSSRRIDPQHWATLLEKAKKNVVSEKQENTTVGPLPLVIPQVKTPSEDRDSSGMLSLDEEKFIVLETAAPSVSARVGDAETGTVSHGLVMNRISSIEVSPAVSPQRPQPKESANFKGPYVIYTTVVPKNRYQTVSSKMECATSLNSAATFSLLPGEPRFQDAGQVGRGAHLQSADPVTGKSVVTGTMATDSHLKMPSSDIVEANASSESVNPTDTITGLSKAQSSHIYSHTKLPGDSSTAAPPPFQFSRSSTASLPLSRHFGRQRKTWGRGRIISPYRTPVLRRHRYGIVGPTPSRAANRSVSASPATQLYETCPSCPHTERLTLATAALSDPGSSPNALLKATGVEFTTLAQYPSLLLENKENINTEKTTPTMTTSGAESTQGTPAQGVISSTPTSRALEEAHTANDSYPSPASTRETKRDLVTTTALPGALTKPSVPTKEARARFSRRKIPWHQILANNANQKGILKNLNKFGLQKSTATVYPKIFPFLPTNKVPLSILPTTMVTTHHNSNSRRAHSAGRLLAGKEQLFPSFYPELPGTTSQRPHATSSLSVETAPLTTSPAPGSSGVYETQPATPRAGQDQRIKEPGNKNDPNPTPGQSLGFTKSPAGTLGLTTADTSIKPGVSAFTRSPLQDAGRIVGTMGLYPGTLTLKGVTENMPQEGAETLMDGMVVSETAWFSQSQESTTVEKTLDIPPFLSSVAPLMSTRTSPPLTHSAVTLNVAMPFQVMTDTVVTRAPLRPYPDLEPFEAEVTTSSEAHPHPELMTGETLLTYSSLLRSSPAPTLRIVKPQNPTGKPSDWPKNQSIHKSYSEMVERGQKAAAPTLPSLSSPGATSRATQWGGQKKAKGRFDKNPVANTTSKPLPFYSLPVGMYKKPSIVGGRAASFTVLAGSDAFLPCKAAGSPLPTIHWTRVSSGLEFLEGPPKARFHVLPNGTLSIQSVNIQDHGQYVCSASNPLGTDHLHVTLSVVSYPPRVLERRTKEITVHSGSSVELKCKVEGRPSPTISWILANQTVVSETSEEKSKVLVTSDGTLVIHSLSIYDRGLYKCVANSSAGQDSLLVRVQVIAAPPVILEDRRQVVAGTQGDSLKLPCTAQGTPQPRVHWVLSDGTEIKTSQFINTKLRLYLNGTLHIRNIAPSDRGTYECIATSSSGSERRVVILTVEERETTPRIEVASQKWTELNLGDKLLLNCSASGDPKPTIIWRLPSKAVVGQWHRMGSRIHVYPNGSLFIGSMTGKDGGDYVCVARNKMGDDLTLMHVRLRLTPAKIDHKHHLKKQVLHGKDFRVDCKASGSPMPEISWGLPDGTVINSAMQADDNGHRTKRYTLFHNGTLYFNKVGASEEGEYTCYAQNTLGKDEMKVHLTVVTTSPQIGQGYKTVRVPAGGTAVLDCKVTGEPKPKIGWLLPSRDMILFSKHRYMVHVNGSLSIHNVKLLDSGEYVCVARNPSGDDTKTYKLDVVSKPPLINGVYTNRTIRATAIQHSRKHFDCPADGIPSPQITWIMPDNIALRAPYYGSRVTVHKNGTLEIRNVRLSDSADFICVARNEGGESVLVVQLEVLEMLRRPTFRNPFNAKVVAERGKPTTLNCSVDGNPPPEIIWILPNGTQFSNRPHSSQYLIASNGSLVIYKMTRSHAGKYRCTARNKVGYIEKLILLEMGQTPVILTNERGRVKGVSGEPLSLHCVTDGIPKPSIRWTTPSGYVMNRPQGNGRYILHENGTLVIREATAYDRGDYVCQAQNSVGHALVTVPVIIIAYPPRIVNHPPRRVLARAGVAFQVHCVALGVPKPEVAWERPDHSTLSKTSKGRAHRSKGLHPQGTLVIQSPQTSDSGLYRCLAKNPLGSDYATTYIQVL